MACSVDLQAGKQVSDPLMIRYDFPTLSQCL